MPNILIVADEAVVQECACRALAAGSFRVTGVDEPDEALEIVRQMPVDVALVDVTGSAGRESIDLVATMRGMAPGLPIVLVTARPCMQMASEAMRLGVIDLLLRPLSATDLGDALERALEWAADARPESAAHRRLAAEMEGRAASLAACAAAVDSPTALQTWLSAVYGGDRRGLDHVRRVAHLSTMLAIAIGVMEPELSDTERAALLHDVGKLAIPEAIMTKSEPLTPTERSLAREHVRIASAVAEAAPFLQSCADIVLATREHFDGTGYPRQLSGGTIPLGARIIAVAEAFDALTAVGGGAECPSHSDANAELVRAAGRRFDPAVIRAWLQCSDLLGAADRDAQLK